MGLFDGIQANLDAIAGKVGISPEQVQTITNTLESQLQQCGGDHLSALQATAAEHGVSVEMIQQMLNHGGVADQIESYAKSFL